MVLDWDTLKGFPVVALPVVGEPQFQTDGHHGKFVAMPLKESVAMSENGDFVSPAQSCCPIIDVTLAGCSLWISLCFLTPHKGLLEKSHWPQLGHQHSVFATLTGHCSNCDD